MNTTLRVLIVEDSESDTGLIVRHLERAGYKLVYRRIETPSEMRDALEKEVWDIVVADFTMPRFDALAALRLLQEKDCDTPFIVVSGSIGEDTAVSMMKSGVHDYVMKDNLTRLVPAVQRELRDAEVRRKRRRAEEALRQSEERYRALYEDNPSMYFTMDEDGTVLSVNRFGAEELGYAVEELVGRPVLDIFHPDDRDAVREQFKICLQNPMKVGRWEFRKVRKDTSILWVKEAARSVKGPDGKTVVLVVCEDITKRKLAEEESVRLATAIEQAAEGYIVTDKDWVIHYVNPAFERMSGYERSEITGRHSRILKSGKHDDSYYKRIRHTLTGGQVWSGRCTSRRKDGAFYEVEVTASPVRNKSGAIINFVSVHRDVTHEIRLERELRQAQKMEAIGTLAGGIAHDFNNILTAITGYAQLAHSRARKGSVVRRYLDQVLEASFRATDLVKQILTFSRKTERERKPMLVAPVVKEAIKLLRSSLPSTIKIFQDITVASGGGVVRADPTQIHQVLINLGTNAAHAMRATGGVLSVQLSEVMVDASLASRCRDLEPGPYVRLSVSDDGHGMDATIMERIFDPYFTTKGAGEGTGLGLSVVQGIVKSHGGAVTVYSEPGQGTTFHIFLPLIEEEISPMDDMVEAPPTGSERLLFVDDEELLVNLGREMLESLGYTVIAKTNSLEALESFRAQPEAFDMVITDMTMPGLTGTEFAKRLISIRPNVPVILSTGFSDLVNGETSEATGIREFLMKPYVIGTLATIVRKVLDEK